MDSQRGFSYSAFLANQSYRFHAAPYVACLINCYVYSMLTYQHDVLFFDSRQWDSGRKVRGAFGVVGTGRKVGV
jgi:hypothetical protein